MDPRSQNDQTNPQTGVDQPANDQPLDTQQAADLIRQQIQSIHSGLDPASPETQAVQNSQSATVQTQQTAPVKAQTSETNTIPSAPHFNPYHQVTNPIVAANTPQQPSSHPTAPTVSQPPQPIGQVAESGDSSYRKNYSTFSVPSVQQPTKTSAPVVVNSPQPLPTESSPMVVNAPGLDPSKPPIEPNETGKSVAELKERVVKRVQGANTKKARHRLKPLFISLAIGLLFLGVNYNEVAVAQVKQYISPGDSISTPVILEPSDSVDVGPDPKIIIPKINLEAPVVYDIVGYDEGQIQDGLERGVVHYGTTALPGEKGNNVIVGHSSNNYFNSGEYKFAFVLLFRLEKDDTFILHYKGERYVYKVFNKQVIDPSDFSLIQPTEQPVTTLITCTPPGTSWKRLVIQAVQISPDPTDATKTQSTGVPDDIESTVPGNAPSLWQRITDSIF